MIMPGPLGTYKDRAMGSREKTGGAAAAAAARLYQDTIHQRACSLLVSCILLVCSRLRCWVESNFGLQSRLPRCIGTQQHVWAMLLGKVCLAARALITHPNTLYGDRMGRASNSGCACQQLSGRLLG
jgi:hypothetical protein